MNKIIIGILIGVFISVGYFIKEQGRFSITNERIGFMLLKGRYRSWWINYSNGLMWDGAKWKNLWRFPRYSHLDMKWIQNT